MSDGQHLNDAIMFATTTVSFCIIAWQGPRKVMVDLYGPNVSDEDEAIVMGMVKTDWFEIGIVRVMKCKALAP